MKWNRKLGSKASQGIVTSKAPQNRKEIKPKPIVMSMPTSLDAMEAFLKANSVKSEVPVIIPEILR